MADDMPNRKRFHDLCLGKRPGDVPIYDWFNKYWSEVPEVWVEQGAPKEILNPDGYRDYFPLRRLPGGTNCQINDIIGGGYFNANCC
jgi:hypothetical protein